MQSTVTQDSRPSARAKHHRHRKASADNIEVWASRASGPDPRIHYWFKKGQVVRKLCDSVEWGGHPEDENGLGFTVLCRMCVAMKVEDALHGRDMLVARYVLPPDHPCHDSDVKARSLFFGKSGIHKNSRSGTAKGVVASERNPMPRISMRQFVEYYFADAQRKRTFVSNQQKLEVQRAEERTRPHDYYWWFRHTVTQAHIKTQDLDCFKDALAKLVDQTSVAHRKERFRELGSCYIEIWEGLDASPATMPRARVEVAGLTIGINPNLRINHASGATDVLRMWFADDPILIDERQVMSNLLHMAKETYDWPTPWRIGFLDVRNKSRDFADALDLDVAAAIESQAAQYVEMWGRN